MARSPPPHGSGPLSDALEVAFQIVAAEANGRGPTVRAVVRVLGEFALGQQRGDGFRRQPVAGSHGGVAGHQAEQVVEQLFAAGHTQGAYSMRVLPGTAGVIAYWSGRQFR